MVPGAPRARRPPARAGAARVPLRARYMGESPPRHACSYESTSRRLGAEQHAGAAVSALEPGGSAGLAAAARTGTYGYLWRWASPAAGPTAGESRRAATARAAAATGLLTRFAAPSSLRRWHLCEVLLAAWPVAAAPLAAALCALRRRPPPPQPPIPEESTKTVARPTPPQHKQPSTSTATTAAGPFALPPRGARPRRRTRPRQAASGAAWPSPCPFCFLFFFLGFFSLGARPRWCLRRAGRPMIHARHPAGRGKGPAAMLPRRCRAAGEPRPGGPDGAGACIAW